MHGTYSRPEDVDIFVIFQREQKLIYRLLLLGFFSILFPPSAIGYRLCRIEDQETTHLFVGWRIPIVQQINEIRYGNLFFIKDIVVCWAMIMIYQIYRE
jgi:hypothetical protein